MKTIILETIVYITLWVSVCYGRDEDDDVKEVFTKKWWIVFIAITASVILLKYTYNG